ncbi:MAG TPA: discoidin domain-containing protein [Polyangiales bacterium]|nr:discoidin domain-containing protein [Polyangiales bacterium]
MTLERIAILGLAVALFASGAGHAAAQAESSGVVPCPGPVNLLKNATVVAPEIKTGVGVVTDGAISVEGSFWSGNDSVVLPKDQPVLGYDLGGVQLLKAFLLQGDNNEDYILEGSTDTEHWAPLWTAPPVWVGQGLRTRSVVLKQPVAARYVRVNPQGGDGFYSVSELQAYCEVPKAFPPKLRKPPAKFGWDAINNEVMVNIKGVTAVIAALLLLASYWRRFYELRITGPTVRVVLVGTFVLLAAFSTWLGVLADNGKGPAALAKFARVSGSSPGWYYSAAALFATAVVILLLCMRKQAPRVFDTSLAVVGLFSFFSWWNLGHYHFDHYVHIWEHYHYIVGAKYGPELRYARLYQCTAVADIQDGHTKQVKERKMRRIEADNELGTTDEVIKDPTICTKHFTPERWEAFRKDIRWFRAQFSTARWDESQQDHGYNATPVWGILGRFLADHTEFTWNNIVKLGVIDSLFLIAMWIAVLWAFGWRAACVGLIYWGTNFPARFYWNGGSFLRYDWLLWLVVGVCLLRKNRMALGGAALTYATLLRVFPGFVIATLILKAIAGMVRERRIFLTREHQWFAAGCIAALAVLVPASSWATNGLDAWGEFAHNSQKHLATALTNNMGLKTVTGWDYATRAINMRNDKLEDPFKEWKVAKHHFYTTRAPIFALLILAFCFMLAKAADRERDDWVAACLGTGLIVIGPELTCYYYGFLLTYGLLWPRLKVPGIVACVLAAVTCFIADMVEWYDDQFAGMSFASVIAVFAVTAWVAFSKRSTAGAEVVTKKDEKPAAPEPATPPILAEPR